MIDFKESEETGLGIKWPHLNSLPEGGEKFKQLDSWAQAIRQHVKEGQQ
jgi:hypothetical protein